MKLSQEDLLEFVTLLTLDLENGHIEKAVSLFQYNKTLYQTLGKLLSEGSMFVRLGVNMLLEDLMEIRPDEVQEALPFIIPLLKDENPTIRGDAADIIGIIGGVEHLYLLEAMLADEHSQVVEVVEEAIESIQDRTDLN